MFWNIFKRDIKRKKTMNIIILLFILLATMFVASGINNVLTTMNGTDYYLHLAGIGDYIAITQFGDGGIPQLLDEEDVVEDYRGEHVIFASKDNLESDGAKLDSKNTVMIQAIEEGSIHFFDKDNKEIQSVSDGQAYISGKFLKKNNLQTGDTITISHGNTNITVTIAGAVKDALLGSDFMGNTRVLLSDSDFQKFTEDESLREYNGMIFYIDTQDVSEVASALSDASNVLFAGNYSVIKMCYVMEMIVAFVVLVLSVCLMLVSFVVLQFTINFTISEEYREIGVMKAIGITNQRIRRLYIIKYLVLALIGAGLGLAASIPFGKLLLQSVSENMVLGNEGGILINVCGAVAVIGVTVAFAYRCTWRVKKLTPVDAIRSGQTGERFQKKTLCRLGKSHLRPSLYMAWNDVLSSPKRYSTIIISFFVCSVFVLGVVITTDTMKSKNLITTFGLESDVYVTDVNLVMQYMGGKSKEDLKKCMEDKADELTRAGMPSTMSIEVQYKYKVTFEGKSYNISCQQGINTHASDYEYTEGTAPEHENEIAITKAVSEMTGAKIGDILTIDFGSEQRDCMVTGYFQTMNNLGETIRLHEDAPTELAYISSAMSFQIDFTDYPSDKVIDERVEAIKELWNNDEVMNAADYCADCIGVVDTMEAVQYLLLIITVIVVILVTILMERSFIADEKGQIALLKAIGFKDSDVIMWHIYRFGIVSMIAEVLAVILAKPVTSAWCTPIFGMMGATHINYYINPLQVFLLYPGIIFLVMIGTVWLTALYTKTIKSRDSASIE